MLMKTPKKVVFVVKRRLKMKQYAVPKRGVGFHLHWFQICFDIAHKSSSQVDEDNNVTVSLRDDINKLQMCI